MITNPELRRNLWLEATPARLVLIPAVVGAVLFLGFVADGRQPGSATALAALVCLGILTWGWGAHLASESVLSELRGRTWDWQRMSGLGAWTLTWGKLVGATSPAWYGGALCLAVYAIARPADAEDRAWLAALVVLAGVLGQAGTFLAALHQASRGRAATRAQSSFYVVAGALVVLQVVTGAARSAERDWYGLSASPLVVGTLSVGAFAAFAVVGAWVRVRRELRIRTLSVAWPSFLLFGMVWAAGFAGPELGAGGRPTVAFLVAVAATWVTALLDAKEPVALRRLARAAREARWRTLAEELPPWLIGLPFVLAAWIGVVVAPPVAVAGGQGRVLTFAIALFLVRDVALVVFLSLGARPWRSDLLAVVLFAFGYVLVPLVLSASGLRAAAGVLFPDPDRALLSAGAAAIEAAMAASLLALRWRSRAREVEAGGRP